MWQDRGNASPDDVLIVRTDASTTMGTGHVMRSLAIVQTWSHHRGRAAFISAALPENVGRRLVPEGMGVVRMEDHGGDAARTI